MGPVATFKNVFGQIQYLIRKEPVGQQTKIDEIKFQWLDQSFET